jgi:uncharacterized protein YqjF (DUF2071 family)
MGIPERSPTTPPLKQRLQVRDAPSKRPFMYQTWSDLLFLHWIVDAQAIQLKLPKGLFVDCFDGNAYVGVVPFFMRNIRLRGMPAIPWLSNFLELNLRTYVYDSDGTPGVWFFSLDCNQPLAVWGARTLYHLPYQHARMQAHDDTSRGWKYCSQRSRSPGGNASKFHYVFSGDVHYAQPGTLEFFLTERYVLFASTRDGGLAMGHVHHTPYPLESVEVLEAQTDLFTLNGFNAPTERCIHAIGSRGVDVMVYSLQREVNSNAVREH